MSCGRSRGVILQSVFQYFNVEYGESSSTSDISALSLLNTEYQWWNPTQLKPWNQKFIRWKLVQHISRMSYFEMSGGVNFSETELQTTDCMKINISSLAWTGTTTTMWIVLQVSSSFTDKHSMTANLLHDSSQYLWQDCFQYVRCLQYNHPKCLNENWRKNLLIRILLPQHFRKFYKQRMEA